MDPIEMLLEDPNDSDAEDSEALLVRAADRRMVFDANIGFLG
jgi:hypothetical protein